MQLDPNDTPDPATGLDAHGLLTARRGVAAGRRLHARLHPDPATGTDDAPGRGMDAGRDLYRNHNHGGTR